MYFANPLGLLALLSLPAIVAIHLYHRRFPPLQIAGAHLWGAETQVHSPGRRRERLPITASLLLELLAALLLSLVLSQPRFDDFDRVEHVVAVLDNSASMLSTPDDGAAIRDAAITELSQRVNSLGRRTRVTLILTGRRPVMLAGPAVEWAEAEAALAAWSPTAPQHDFEMAWDLASQIADESGRLVFLTDRVPPDDRPTPRRVEIVSVGLKSENVALSDARWTFDSTANVGRVFLRVSNLGKAPAHCALRGVARDQVVFRKPLAIPAGEETTLETEVPGGLGRLTIELDAPGDGLSIDNRVTLIEPSVRMLTLAVRLPPESAAAGFIQRVLTGIPDTQQGAAAAADLVFAPAESLPRPPSDAWWFAVGPLDDSETARNEARDLVGPYLLEKRNPLLQGVSLEGVIWGGVQPSPKDATPIISAGRSLLLSRLNDSAGTTYVLNIDLGRSNLTDSPDWPILIQNLIELRRDNLPGLRRWNYRLNEEIQFRLYEGLADPAGDDPAELTLMHDGKTRPLARTATVELPPLDQAGVYEIRDGEQTIGEFAVNFFDPGESNLTGLSPGTRAPLDAVASAGFLLEDTYTWVLMAGIALIMLAVLLDWRVLKQGR